MCWGRWERCARSLALGRGRSRKPAAPGAISQRQHQWRHQRYAQTRQRGVGQRRAVLRCHCTLKATTEPCARYDSRSLRAQSLAPHLFRTAWPASCQSRHTTCALRADRQSTLPQQGPACCSAGHRCGHRRCVARAARHAQLCGCSCRGAYKAGGRASPGIGQVASGRRWGARAAMQARIWHVPPPRARRAHTSTQRDLQACVLLL